MDPLDLLPQSSSSVTLLGAVVFLLVLYIFSSSFISQKKMKEPPGPTALPLLGNLLQMDLKRPYITLSNKSLKPLSKKHGSVFTVYFGPKKVVVLAGYKTVKQALVSHAAEFGDREILPLFGILFNNGESWRELRRFALSNLRDFGMGKKAAEEKIVEECQHLIKVFEKHEGNLLLLYCVVLCHIVHPLHCTLCYFTHCLSAFLF
uniref:Cytochrome P450 2K1-like n=1 Tax=Myripristis murdjan TaxID=586833 RepID=A0A668ACP1_9TELE